MSTMMLVDRSSVRGHVATFTRGEEETGGCPKCRQGWRKCCLPRPLRGTADIEQLSATLRDLAECGWYYGPMSRKQSVHLLHKQPLGLFLLRDSSDPRFLFSLSVQTAVGPTSVRIHYSDGRFRLDAEPSLAGSVPTFQSVVALVQHYVSLGGPQLCLSGSKYSHVLLRAPLYKNVPSLKHLARLSLNRLVHSSEEVAPLPIPIVLKKYLIDYPYTR